MNRRKFTILIGMMLFSVIGIIWVQITWISDAVRISNEAFNRAVYGSMQRAAGAIESSRKMDFFNNFLLADKMAPLNPGTGMSGYLSIGTYSSGSNGNIRVDISNQTYSGTSDTGRVTSVNKSFVFSGDTTMVSDSVTYLMADNDGDGRMTVIGEPVTKGHASEKVYVRQNEFMDWVRKRSSEFQNLSEQMISEIYQWEKTMELDGREVQYALNQSFTNAGIATPFEFAIIRNGNVNLNPDSKGKKEDFLKSDYLVRLFPDNIVRQDLLISVVFPERANYVLGEMIWILGGSMLFSLFILATFALSIFFILRQKKISEMKSDFINNMTHEFKTPIATISLAADTITNPKVINDEKSIRHFVGMIKKENSRMNKKVETILQIASLDRKEIDFRFDNTSMHDVIEFAIDTLDIQIRQKGGTIETDLSAENPVIYGDADHLMNLVSNLLDNALKYSADKPEIKVVSWNNERGFLFAVEDKGIGMTKAVQSRIFERFYRQASVNIHDVKGFGLGLNYVRAIVEAHKGTINVTSEPGKGSRFEIFLPFNFEG
jgi:two-component system, OmpR family, phosphate regulon sensor histidine kinase PhoR